MELSGRFFFFNNQKKNSNSACTLLSLMTGSDARISVGPLNPDTGGAGMQ